MLQNTPVFPGFMSIMLFSRGGTRGNTWPADKEKTRSLETQPGTSSAAVRAIPAAAPGALVDTPEENVRRAIVRSYTTISIFASR